MNHTVFFEAEMKDEVFVIRPLGQFNCWQMPTLKTILESYLLTNRQPQLVINFKHVRFVDTPTFRQLYEWLEKARMFGGDIKLCELKSTMATLLETQSLHNTFHQFSNEGIAIKAFEQSTVA
jgi:anti-anti-sigma factor